ncbi:redoxin family protein [Bowmanella sp. JS7-9]|uniref:Redoxin family protein n=1 Tax=Pseudobowmanella zhangzhouensis TaxID=1537679 RepID=A0ABW1XL55_9ALTE|nr:redoxin family protein [Bowmanella sp. JS7-9]TBX25827.1 thiol:disulfide interchange protein DsbE [Bowmanella sp. JS7-9]
MKSRLILVLPLLIFFGISIFLFSGLFSDPTYKNQVQVSRDIPEFALADLMQPQVIYDQSVFSGEVTLLNVWGVWCVTCDVELPFLSQLREQGVRIVGLYLPESVDADFGTKPLAQLQREVTAKLQRLGNPYQFNILDADRQYSIDLGVTGAPETYLVDKKGVIRMHLIGDINPQNWQTQIAPLYQELLAE